VRARDSVVGRGGRDAFVLCGARSTEVTIEQVDAGAIRTIALLGTHLPRRCGIAAFTADLGDALGSEFPALTPFVLAMNDSGRSYSYPRQVRFEIAETDVASYRRAADFLNVNAVDVVSVQHEFGIFGGKAGAHVLGLLRELRMPIVTTLHTILSAPNAQQRDVMHELVELSERIVVMSKNGAEMLCRAGVPEAKIDRIPHGIPSISPSPGSKYRLGVEGKFVILTFGLLSPDKGIEHVIDALPAIVKRCPETLYVVLGATHPHVKEQRGETYRIALEHRAQMLGVDSHIMFYDRFVSQEELVEFLNAADVYVTPYLNTEQVTSGTLAYAVGLGKAVISTPYSYAREILAEGRGVLVPPRDAGAIAEAAIELLTHEDVRAGMAGRAADFGRAMAWPVVARGYHASFERARASHADRRRTGFQAKTMAKRAPELLETNLDHVRRMTDSAGILQHATFSIPRYEDGYCLDDNARALLLMALVEDAGTEDTKTVRELASRYLAFVHYAFNADGGRFRNLITFARRFTEERGSEDSHARALWALGAVVGRSLDPGKQSLGGRLFHAALPVVNDFRSPRAWAFALLGIDEYLRAFRGDSAVEGVRDTLADRLLDLFHREATHEWPWFEDRLTYDNARLSQALIVSGSGMRRTEMTAIGLQSLDWLDSVQRSESGAFAPVGSNGFYRRGGQKASFDQQPLEAGAMVSACLEAWRVTGDGRWTQPARRAFAWFLGKNHLQQSLYDASTGGCRDGLHADRANENQGAESTLAFQLALLEIRTVDRGPAVRLVAGGTPT
jgi:glycosyltransferase involved in cell wall biosynthesis